MDQSTCKDCHQPIHFVPAEGRWYHDSLTAILSCPGITIEPAGVTA